MPRSEPPVEVHIPGPRDERPVLSRVGAVAVIGFLVGVAWPKLLGVELGPDVPGGKERSASPAASAPAAAPSADEPPEDAEAAAEADKPTNKQRAVLTGTRVAACRDAKGKKLETCKPLAVDKLLSARLAELASCPAAIGLEGTLELEIELNFEKRSIQVDQGEKSAFPTSTVRGVLTCAASALETLELDKLQHHHPRTTLLSTIRFVPPGKALEEDPAPTDAAAKGESPAEGAGLGSATVTWEKALLRDAPKDGKVVARVPQGSRLEILEQKDEWYLVQKGTSKGWVYRQAIGK